MSEPSTETRNPGGWVHYAVVWGALMALTGLTYGVSRIDLGSWNLVIALSISCAKSALVLLFFMHLWNESASNRLIPLVALGLVILMCSLTALDVHTRYPLAAPPGSRRALVPVRGQLD